MLTALGSYIGSGEGRHEFQGQLAGAFKLHLQKKFSSVIQIPCLADSRELCVRYNVMVP